MRDIEYLDNKEMIEDLKMMLNEENYERTMAMVNLTEEEHIVFQRAQLHLKRAHPNPLIIKRAYEILIAKSFHNKSISSSENEQNILGNVREERSLIGSIKTVISENLTFIIFSFLFALILKSFF